MANKSDGTRITIVSLEDRLFIDRLRGFSILRVVLAHLGLVWIYPPYSSAFSVFLPILFFVSGSVSYQSFLRSENTQNYLVKRLLSLLLPYYVIVALVFVVFWSARLQLPQFNPSLLFRWITLNPPQSSYPYPLGQIWFLHTLAVVTIFSPLFFILIRGKKIYGLYLISFSIVFSALQMFFNIEKIMIIFGHTFYNSFVAISYYCAGAILFSYEYEIRRKIALYVALLCFPLASSLPTLLKFSVDFRDHSFAMDLYYTSGSFLVISIILVFQRSIDRFCIKMKLVDILLKFASKHSYSIFMIHSYVVVFAEKYLGLISVRNNPLMALSKVVFVLLFSCIMAVPVTYLCNIFLEWFLLLAKKIIKNNSTQILKRSLI